MEIIFSSALLLGFAGSLHCLGMCGPIAFAIRVDRRNKMKMILQNLTYQIGRITSYCFLGLLFGSISYGISLAGFQKGISIALGITMILSVFLSKKILNKIRIKPYDIFLIKMKNSIGKYIKKKGFYSLFITGIFNGLLPCGLVYIAIGASLASGSSLKGGIFMFFFGLGTIPLMFSTVLLGNFIGQSIKESILGFIPLVIFSLGFLLIIRGLNLNIPYLSPSKEALEPPVRFKKNMHHCH